METLGLMKGLILLGGIIAIAVIVMLMIREVIAWYYKVNKRIALLEDILKELQMLNINVKNK